MLILVGPESVISPCIGSSCIVRALDPQGGKLPLQRGISRVRLVRAGFGMRKMENMRVRVLSRRFNGDRFSARPAIQSRRIESSQAQDDDDTTEVSTSESKQEKEQEMMMGWRLKAVEAVTSVLLVFGPGVDMNDKVVSFSSDAALASANPIANMRAGNMLMDKMVGGFKSSKVFKG